MTTIYGYDEEHRNGAVLKRPNGKSVEVIETHHQLDDFISSNNPEAVYVSADLYTDLLYNKKMDRIFVNESIKYNGVVLLPIDTA